MSNTTVGEEVTEFVARDGLKLFVRLWRPIVPIRGSILWVHGGCEHGGRYDHLRPLFQQAGWLVILPDHRGHGRSGGERTDVVSLEDYLNDLTDLQQQFCPGGRADVVLGHSFGGLLALRLAETTPPPKALVLTAPLLGLLHPVALWKRAIGRVLVYLAPQTRFRTRINPRNMTRDPAFLEQRLADPLLIRSVTVRWFYAMQQGLRDVWQQLDDVTCPVLVLQGLADRTVDPAAVERFVAARGQRSTRLITYPDHVHEVLQEADWPDIAATILAWLDEQVPVGKDAPAQANHAGKGSSGSPANH